MKKPDFTKVPSHIRHAVTAPKCVTEKGKPPWKVLCKCGWTFFSRTQARCERIGTQHIQRHEEWIGDS